MSSPTNPSPEHAVLARFISVPRLQDYISHCGDTATGLELYRWNTEISGALWETFGHLEVALRNALAERLEDRHVRHNRSGIWLNDPAGELAVQAHDDIVQASGKCLRRSTV